MNSFKKTTLMIAVLASLLVPTKKAKAGLLLIQSGGSAAVVVGYVFAGAGSLALAPVMLSPRWDESLKWFLIGGLAGVALDEQDDNNISKLSSMLATRYSFINDESIFEEISGMVNDKYKEISKEQPLVDGEQIATSLDEAQVRDIFKRVDHTGIEDEVENLIQDLI